jgi:hypothetical protein
MIKKFLMAAMLVATLSGFGCSTTPTTPAQSVYQVQGTYAAALQVAVTYKQLPSCAQPGHPVLCAQPAVVQKLQKADDVAYAALTAAQNTVRTPGAGVNVQTALVAAQQAVNAFAAITATIKVKQ